MARPRTPTAVLERRGSFISHKDRKEARAFEPVPSGELGSAPRHFSKDEKKVWKELEKIAPPGVLADCDRWTVEIAVKLMSKFRLGTITSSGVAQLITFLSKMGMTPSDRSKVMARPSAALKDEWDDLDSPSQTM